MASEPSSRFNPYRAARPPFNSGIDPSMQLSGYGQELVNHNSLLQAAKRIVDVVGASVLLIVFSPIFVVLGVLVARSGGPVFFHHQRIGRGGREFPCYKFRTMVTDGDRVLKEYLAKHPEARREWQAERKLRKDPRVTAVGQLLRKTSLDELPQLFNVLRGEMSLVGPRPVVKSELELYGKAVAHYAAVRPGMTGLWQVTGRNNTTYRRRVLLDSYYVKRMSPWLDVVILFKTIRVVLLRSGAY